ncbi:fumarylacetoacetate hydrolase family protein [Tautonia plasticadhaerens]|uniref:Ureidoglycolate lyase n=1 Tax=Tautonia plasticadhaerens TaxID=2527974 RepID=A0A518HBV2_9BACT|nr:fumarylacetoacetate hydrolase family protein [Tautonia plasticadhaerens]QDV38325.1 Ureidoglycolate lyase [Tautonia plasticadhaerens]
MRLLTVATDRGPRACAEHAGRLVDLNAADPTLPNSVRELIALGPDRLSRARSALDRAPTSYDPASSRLLAPVPDPRKIICLGLNYRDHAIETGAKIPEEPILFSKYPTALTGHKAPILLPKICHEVDFEAELVFVIGLPGRDIPRDRAMDHVAGYAVGHDVSARDWQLGKPGGQWMAGKTFDTFAPVGPSLVTADEVPDPHALGIRLRLNGRLMQDSSTSQLIFRVPETIAYLSQIMTLEPGDLVFTGTPPGVGMARKPPVWLKPGDVVEVEIDGLGTLSNPIEARP